MIGTKIIEERKSKYNGNLRVVKTFGMGIYIQSNGLTQSGGIVETIWKQTINKFKSQNSCLHRRANLKTCLILGLGGGTVAKLIRRKYPDVKITGIEIDPVMIMLGKKYLHLNDQKTKIIIGDVADIPKIPKFPKQKFDLIFVDLYQGDKYPRQFETEAFLNIARTVLAKNGKIIFNRLYYGDKRPQAVKFGKHLEKHFSKVEWFYPEANLMFICCK